MIASLVLALSPFVSPQGPFQERLDDSRRHQEWADVKRGERTIRTFVVYPESKDKVASVLVIHENKGLTDWVRGVADQLAEAGYVAVAPDLLSGAAPGGGNTDGFESTDAATKAIYALDPEQVMADLDAVADFAAGLPASSGKLSVAGFCWGGSRSFDFATHRRGLEAAFVFYGVCVDDDSDGVCSGRDCDDGDATVFPGATEVPGDGVDQDCDGADAEPEDTGDTDTDTSSGTNANTTGSGGGNGESLADACPDLAELGKCGQGAVNAKPKPVNMLIVLDKSGSMNQESNGVQRWSAMKDALGTALREVQDNIAFGLEMYPFPNLSTDTRAVARMASRVPRMFTAAMPV